MRYLATTFRFAKFLGIEPLSHDDDDDVSPLKVEVNDAADIDDFDDEDDDQFEMLLDELGIRTVIGKDDQVEPLKSIFKTSV